MDGYQKIQPKIYYLVRGGWSANISSSKKSPKIQATLQKLTSLK